MHVMRREGEDGEGQVESRERQSRRERLKRKISGVQDAACSAAVIILPRHWNTLRQAPVYVGQTGKRNTWSRIHRVREDTDYKPPTTGLANKFVQLDSAAHILKLEQYRED